MRFNPITLFLRSSCVQDSEDPITVTDTLWNKRDKDHNRESLIFTPPCPAIRWAGRREEHELFQYSQVMLSSLGSLLEVSIFNEVGIRDWSFTVISRSHNTFLTLFRIIPIENFSTVRCTTTHHNPKKTADYTKLSSSIAARVTGTPRLGKLDNYRTAVAKMPTFQRRASRTVWATHSCTGTLQLL